ncbi:hypothetical protein [Glutamicibacter sp.]|uniref:hypothetical protein n=1 Tax=Glutamicibacter sp. TaxID=1931995 RepID=UPI002B49295D|nr:hypothetical protein [Glutamicibacter sp.]HJX78677.1 hypothetical protein [Glutamicibacter sp.]
MKFSSSSAHWKGKTLNSSPKRIYGLAGAITLMVPLLLATGCSKSQERCLPEAMSLSETTAQPGGTITVSAPAAKCDLGYAEGKNYTLRLISEYSETDPLEGREILVNTDGSFSDEVPIPTDFPQGAATLLVTGSPYDECGDAESCAAYSHSFAVTADKDESAPNVLDHLDSLLFEP